MSLHSLPANVVTLIIRSRPPKSNQFFFMSQSHIHKKLVRIHPLLHKILCRQAKCDADADANANRNHTKINMSHPSPCLVRGHNCLFTGVIQDSCLQCFTNIEITISFKPSVTIIQHLTQCGEST